MRGPGKSSPVDQDQVKAYVRDRATGVPAADMDIDVSWDSDSGAVTVIVTYNYDYIIGGMLGLDPVDLEGRSTMIVN